MPPLLVAQEADASEHVTLCSLRVSSFQHLAAVSEIDHPEFQLYTGADDHIGSCKRVGFLFGLSGGSSGLRVWDGSGLGYGCHPIRGHSCTASSWVALQSFRSERSLSLLRLLFGLLLLLLLLSLLSLSLSLFRIVVLLQLPGLLSLIFLW